MTSFSFFPILKHRPISKTKAKGKASTLSPNHTKNTKYRTSSIAKMPPSPFPSADIIHAENENMDIEDGALHNSLLSEPPGSDFR